MKGDLGRDRIRSLCRDQKSCCLDASEHREEQVQQDVWVRVERLVMKDALQKQRVDDSPGNHDGKERKYEGPRAHHVAHPIGCSLSERELITGSNSRMHMPM